MNGDRSASDGRDGQGLAQASKRLLARGCANLANVWRHDNAASPDDATDPAPCRHRPGHGGLRRGRSRPSRHILRLCCALLALAALLIAPLARATLPIERIRLPAGFHIEVLADDVPSAREMTLSPTGILYVGSMEGRVYALELRDGKVVKRHVVASGLTMPVGVAWHDGAL